MQNMAVKESVEFVKHSSERITRLLSVEHRKMVRQFIAFRNQTFEKMDKMDNYYKEMVTAELALAIKNPVLEAEYQINFKPSPLQLFEGFLPQLKKYMVSKPVFSEVHARAKKEEETYIMISNQILRTENKELKERNSYLEEQKKVVDWIINLSEIGLDHTTLLKNYEQ